MKNLLFFLIIFYLPLNVFSQEKLTEEQERVIKELISRGTELFNEGKFDSAIEVFEKAYEIYPAPDFIYNIARAKEEKGDVEGAIKEFERYLNNNPHSDGAKLAIEKIEKLKEKLEFGFLTINSNEKGGKIKIDGKEIGETPAEMIKLKKGVYELVIEKEGFEKVEQIISIETDKENKIDIWLEKIEKISIYKEVVIYPYRKWSYIGGGIGTLLFGSGILMAILANKDYDKLKSAKQDNQGRIVGMTQEKADSIKRSGDRKKIMSWVLYGASGATIAASVVIFFIKKKEKKAFSGYFEPYNNGFVFGLKKRF